MSESLRDALARVYVQLDRRQTGGGEQQPSPPTSEDWHPFDHLGSLFGLSPFERDVLVLCAGYTLERRFAHATAGAPTFGLALAVLEDPHWSAVTPVGPLRYWRLIELASGNLLDAPLHLEERILQFVLGVPALDERLQALARPVVQPDGPVRDEAVQAATRHWRRTPLPHEALVLIGKHHSVCTSVFAQACEQLRLKPYELDAADIPSEASERDNLARLWTREATLSGAAVLVSTEHCESTRNLEAWLATTSGLIAIAARPGDPAERLDGLRLHVPPISADERRSLWQRDLGPLAQQMNGYLDRVVEYFDFDEAAIRTAANQVSEKAEQTGASPGELAWRTCREHGRRALETLAQRIDSQASWPDLVLPAAQTETLEQIAIHVQQRAVVNHRWGFGAKHARGLGLTVLFTGGSGTGKTMAAEVLASDLDLDLYKVDLASVVSKYIGETEKNLRAIFDGAERSGAILLFDEADALFGKRSEVRDSHDRYANLEISYLLQQMEAYRGVAILTTNMQHALDPAFMRRIRFVVQFPFPDHEARSDIWRTIFPPQTPVADLNPEQLAQLNVSGGVIRNIAINAAFLAADEEQTVQPRHILAAAKTEYAKVGKPLTPAETKGLT